MIFKPYCISRAFFACVAWPRVLPRVWRLMMLFVMLHGWYMSSTIRCTAIHRVRDAAALGTVDAATTVEVRVVKEVEHVKAELDAHTLTPYPPVLVDGEIGVYVPRSSARSDPHDVAGNGSDLIPDQCGCVRVQDLRPASTGRTTLTSRTVDAGCRCSRCRQGGQAAIDIADSAAKCLPKCRSGRTWWTYPTRTA